MTKNKKIKGPAEEVNDSVTDINIKDLIPNVIDDYIITMFEDHHTIVIPLGVTGTQFKAWHKAKGGVFSKDVLNYSLKKSHGKYILLKGKTLNCVARIIDEEEELSFKTLKLVDGQIKDRSYMILKNLENGEKIKGTQRYINEKDINHEDNLFVTASLKPSQDDDVDHHVGSISLFTE